MQMSKENEEAIQTLDVMKHLLLQIIHPHSLHLIGDKGTEGSRQGFVIFPDRRGDPLVDKGSAGLLEGGRLISLGFLIKNFGAVQQEWRL